MIATTIIISIIVNPERLRSPRTRTILFPISVSLFLEQVPGHGPRTCGTSATVTRTGACKGRLGPVERERPGIGTHAPDATEKRRSVDAERHLRIGLQRDCSSATRLWVGMERVLIANPRSKVREEEQS